jgi:hypothetical protein
MSNFQHHGGDRTDSVKAEVRNWMKLQQAESDNADYTAVSKAG